MRNLLTFNDAASYLEIGVDCLYVQSVKKPDWYVKIGKIPYVDVEKFNKQRILTNKCYMFNTNDLYWLVKSIFKTDIEMCTWMAERSNKYKVATSWRHFISTMFATPLTNGVELRYTMQADFLALSIIAITIAKRKGVKFESIYS